jgi:uncharacterized protein (TIGR02231 family)
MNYLRSVRYLSLLISSLLLSSATLANDSSEKQVKAEIKEATVFLNMAQLSSVAAVSLEAGQQKVILTGLANGIDPQSVQVSAKGVMILSVKYRQDYVQPHTRPAEILHLEDSVKFYQFHLANLQDFEAVLRKEEEMLTANQNISGKNTPLDADDLEYFSNFFRKRFLDIRFQLQKNIRDIQSTSEKLGKFQNQINQYNASKLPSGVIEVELNAKAKATVNFDLDYVIVNAGWSPLYDIKVKESAGPVSVGYKARVYQHSGFSWNNIKITLSTTNPSLGSTKPELYPNYLNLYAPFREKKYKAERSAAPQPFMNKEAIAYDAVGEGAPAEPLPVSAVETSLSVNFNIGIPYTIPTGEEGQVVDIQNLDLNATYRHFTVPKISPAAYLVALVTDYDDKNLISGPANIYFENAYVGETYIDVNSTEDTIKLSLGRDNNVLVERKAVKDMKSKSFLGTSRKEVFGYEISVRNSKKAPVNITIEDQIPVSQNEQIEVEAEEISGAQKEEGTGKLTWNLEIKPAATEKVTLKYSVKYPKNQQISGLR